VKHPRPRARVTPREKQVLTLLSRGWTHKEVGHFLECSGKTIDTHLARLRKKFMARNNIELIRVTIMAGCLSIEEWIGQKPA
jgi:DNA-binding NarL/FixJ family response regulator